MRRRKDRTHKDYFEVREQVSELFKELRKKGFVARMNFSCCSSCGAYEAKDIATKQNKRKIVFYHRQGEDSFKIDGRVYLHYFEPNNDDPNSSLPIGEEIAQTLEQYPLLETTWDHDPDKCIIVQKKGRHEQENRVV